MLNVNNSIVSKPTAGIGGWQLLLRVEFPCQFLVAAARECFEDHCRRQLWMRQPDATVALFEPFRRQMSRVHGTLEHVERKCQRTPALSDLKCQRLIIPCH